jgi:hypothetical protein
MSDAEMKTHDTFALPMSVVSKLDVAHLVSEAERVDNELTTIAVRTKSGSSLETGAPVMSEQLATFLEQNGITLGDTRERTQLIKELRLLKDTIPTIHMTFATEADRESLQQLAKWLRESIHPQVVIAVGLQPALVAGVYLRTPNHVHDLSLRAALKGSRGVLTKELEALRGTV